MASQNQSELAGTSVCRKCDLQCRRCTGMGSHSRVCQECVDFKQGDQCMSKCSKDYYADDEHRECFACHDECRGCIGPGPDSCLECRRFKLYKGDPNDNSTSFKCTSACPPDYSYKFDSLEQPYCSATNESAENVMRFVKIFIVLLVLFVALIMSFLHFRQKAKNKANAVQMTNIAKNPKSDYESAETLRPIKGDKNLFKSGESTGVVLQLENLNIKIITTESDKNPAINIYVNNQNALPIN